ncbi:MAG: YcxB family protein [Gammaproteobacteria bacterium]|jgi:hypothetical protein|nr:YcxB family protein [Gammaproteobacteria bacterium]
MVIQQSTTQRNRRIASNALFAMVGVACGVELYGISQQQQLRFLTLEYSLVYGTGFVLAFTFFWLTARRNVQIAISQTGLEISHDEDVIRFAWSDVKRVNQPSLLRRYWLFELKNTKRIKISTRYFSRIQIKQFNNFLSHAINTDAAQATLTDATVVYPSISHPRVMNSNRR